MPVKSFDILAADQGKMYTSAPLNERVLFVGMSERYTAGFIYDKKTKLILYGPGFILSYQECKLLWASIQSGRLDAGYYFKPIGL